MTHRSESTSNRDASDDASGTGFGPIALILFATIFLLIAWDMVGDAGQGADWLHLAIEGLVLVIAAAGIGFLLRLAWRERRLRQSLTQDLGRSRAEAEAWRRESRDLLNGLGAAIERQFRAWQLSPAEAQIGLLLLKGLSLKEIARLRETSERTVREQARGVYRKSGVAGRSEFSAFFLEDLLVPLADCDISTPPSPARRGSERPTQASPTGRDG